MLLLTRLTMTAVAVAVTLACALVVATAAQASVNSDTVAFTTTPPSTVSVGSSVTISATLTWYATASDDPAGESITVDGPGGATCTGTLADSGTDGVDTASCSLTPTQAGSGDWTLSYAGDTHLPASSAKASVTVTPAPTTTTFTQLPPSPSSSGSQLSWVVSVSPAPDGGTVSFTGSSAISSACSHLALQSGTATCTITAGSPASITASAAYSGDGNFAASSASADSITVSAEPTTVTLTGVAHPATNPLTLMDALTLTATVTAGSPAAPVTGGTVDFNDDLYLPSEQVPGCINVPVNASGVATCEVPSYFSQLGGFSPLTGAIDYRYDASYTPSSSTLAAGDSAVLDEFINLVPTTITVTGESPSHPAPNQPISVSARVTPIPRATWTPPGHSFVISANAVTIHLGAKRCSATVNDSTGIASCKLEAGGAGTEALQADYLGTDDPNYLSGAGVWARSDSTPLSVRIDRATSVRVTPATDPAGVKQFVTYTAHVAPNVGGAGTVAFYVIFTNHGTQTTHVMAGCGARTVAKSTGQATCTVSLNSPGSYPIYAIYSGGGSWATAQSPTIHEQVN